MDTAPSSATQTPTHDTRVRAESHEWVWVLRVLALVLGFLIVAVVRSRQVGIPFRDPSGNLFAVRIISTAVMLLAFVAADIVVRWWRDRSRGTSLWQTVRHRWTPYRIGMVVVALLCYQVVYLCYRNLKSWDVFLTPQDRHLLQWDRTLFFGHSPAVLLHDLLGQHFAARFLTQWYESFTLVLTVALVGAMAFTPTVRSAFVFVVSAMWAWILGVGSYYLIPSLGPFHAAPGEFAGLTRTSIQTTQATYVQQRDYLLAHPHAPDAFAQISAFASLHCAMTCLVFLMARYYGLRWLSLLAAVFLAGTLLATVYLGWHFAVDDIAGLAIAWVSVQLGKLTVTGSSGRQRDAAVAP